MRIYQTFDEAINEIRRDLKEMGHKNVTSSYQNKDITNNPDFETYELTNYIYTVTQPDPNDLEPTLPWVDAEFEERISQCRNPGEAWKHRVNVWEEFMNKDGKFDYTYSERFNRTKLLDKLIANLIRDSHSRQHYLSVWHPEDIHNALGIKRIPCTLGYLFHHRQGKLNITYLQRSADFVTHFTNDIYLAHRLQEYIADSAGFEIGHYIHWLGSIHVFAKDVAGVF